LPEPHEAEPPNVAVTQEEANTLVDRLLDAESRGSCADYGALLATTFKGEKHTSGGVQVLDRSAWLAFREPICSHPAEVTSSYIKIVSSRVGEVKISVRRTEEFNDHFDRTIFVGREEGALKVVGDSALGVPFPYRLQATDLPIDAFRFVIHARAAGDGYVSYLAVGDLQTDLLNPSRTLVRTTAGEAFATVHVADDEAPPELKSWLGRRVEVFDAKQPRCRATVRRLVALAPVYKNEVYPSTDKSTRSPREWAAWEVHADRGTLAFELAPDRNNDCRSGFWARAEGVPRPTLFRGRLEALPASLEAAFRASGTWRREKNRLFRRENLRRERQPNERGGASSAGGVSSVSGAVIARWVQVKVETRRFAGTPGGDLFWVVAEARYPYGRCKGGRCAEETGELDAFNMLGIAVWEVENSTYELFQAEDDTYRRRRTPEFFGRRGILFVADLDGDGLVEFVTNNGIYRTIDGKLTFDEAL
jgi:hypothetical protein